MQGYGGVSETLASELNGIAGELQGFVVHLDQQLALDLQRDVVHRRSPEANWCDGSPISVINAVTGHSFVARNVKNTGIGSGAEPSARPRPMRRR